MPLENEILEELKKIREAITKESQAKPKHKGIISEFLEFIGKAGVFGLAIGFIVGSIVGKVVTSLVEDIIMPIPGAFMGGDWKKAVINLPIGNGMHFGIGDFVAAVTDFLIIMVVIFFIAKFGKRAGLKYAS